MFVRCSHIFIKILLHGALVSWLAFFMAKKLLILREAEDLNKE